MSLKKLKEDLTFGLGAEKKVKEMFESIGFEVISTSLTDLLDFQLKKDNITYHCELKTRRFEKDKYPTTLIGANKIAEAYKRYYYSGEQTLFLFGFTDGLYGLNPFKVSPHEIEYKKFRWDRGDIDKPKGWFLYHINDLTLFYNNK